MTMVPGSIWTQSKGEAARAITGKGSSDTSPFFLRMPPGKAGSFFESDRSGQEDLWFPRAAGPRAAPESPFRVEPGVHGERVCRREHDHLLSEVLKAAPSFPTTRGAVNVRSSPRKTRATSRLRISGEGLVAFGRTPLASRRPTESSAILIGSLKSGHLQEARVVAREGFGPLLSPTVDGWPSCSAAAARPDRT